MHDFKFRIGDRVAAALAVEELRAFAMHTLDPMRPHVLVVEERLSVECCGGTQLFYTCRDPRGAVEKHSEASLVEARVMCDAWIDGMKAQKARKDGASST